MSGNESKTKQRSIKTFVTDRDAVSPVIGVILMVAITVILASVIGAFVLNTKPDTEDAPSVSWEYEYDSGGAGTPSVEIIHRGGDRIEGDRLTLTIQDGGTAQPWSSITYVQAGESVTITDPDLKKGKTIRIVWNRAQSQQSNTIGQYTLVE